MGKKRLPKGRGRKKKRRGGDRTNRYRNVPNTNSFKEESLFVGLLKELESHDDGIRYNSIFTISGLLFTKPNKEILKLLKTYFLQKLFQRLVDRVCEVRIVTAGIIKNLIIRVGEQVCDRLLKQDLFSVLEVSLQNSHKEVISTLRSQKKDEFERAVKLLTLIIDIISLLCENSEQATIMFSKMNNFCSILLNVLKDVQPTSVLNAMLLESIVQMIHVLIDENDVFQKCLNSISGSTDFFLSLFKNVKYPLFFRVNLSGILFSLSLSSDTQTTGKFIDLIFGSLINCLHFDCVGGLAKIFPSIFDSSGALNELHGERLKWVNFVKSQKMALEILTNIVSYQSELGTDEMDVSDNESSSSASAAVLSMLSKNDFFVSLLKCFQVLTKNLDPKITSCKALAKDVKLIYTTIIRSIYCINNVVVNCPVALLNKYNVGSMWGVLISLCVRLFSVFQTNLGQQITSMEATSSLLCVLSKKPKINLTVQSQNVQFFLALAAYPNSEAVRANSVSVLLEFAKRTDVLKPFVNLFVKMLGDVSIAVAVESLNAIVELFQTSERDGLFWELGVGGKLKWFEGEFSKRLHNVGQEERGELMGELEMLRNFIRFKYSKKKKN